MLKKIAICGIFALASVLGVSIASASSTARGLDRAGTLVAPHAPIGHGFCPIGTKC
jgi:hypothetical protein